jgi:methionyl-tRNA formyltransferase
VPLRLALFGQAAFGRDVLVRLLERGHEVAAVYAPPDAGRPDPLAEEAGARGLRCLRHKAFRLRGEALAERVAEHRSLGVELNVLAYVTAILPPEIVDGPPKASLCFHPSLLPRFRGGAALAWQIMLGERESGVTVFRPDAGVDTGPIVVQKGGVAIRDTDTAATLYFERLYPLGVDATVEAVDLVASGRARYVPQDEAKASFQGLVGDAEARLDFARSAVELDRQIRGCDPSPGAFALRGAEPVRCFDGRLLPEDAASRAAAPGTLLGVEDGRLRIAARGGCLAVGRVRVGAGPKQPVAEAPLRAGERLA